MFQLRGYPPRHDFSERTKPLEQQGFCLSDQDVGCVTELLALFHQVLRRLAYLLRPPSYFGGKHGATVQMGAGALGQVATTPRAEVRATSERIGGKFHQTETQVTAQTVGDGMPEAVNKEQGALFRGQHAGAIA